MKFFGQNVDKINDPFSKALFEYQNDLERGNYDTLEEYTQDSRNWNNKDELDMLEHNLKPLLAKLPIEGINPTNLRTQLEADLPIGLPRIASLLATLSILNNQKPVDSEEELEQLKATEVPLQVEAAMPGPCLAYLGALRHSSLSNKRKLLSVDNIITNILDNVNAFGVLGNIVLRVAVNDWLQVLHELEPEMQESFSDEVTSYTDQASHCLTVSETKERLTLVEKYTMLSWEKLNNGIGEINLTQARESYSMKG